MKQQKKNKKHIHIDGAILILFAIFSVAMVITVVVLSVYSAKLKMEVDICFDGEAQGSIEVVAGESVSLAAVAYKNGKRIDDADFTWHINDETLGCALTSNGGECAFIAGKLAGKVKLSVALKGKRTASNSIDINISEKVLQSIYVNQMPDNTDYIEGQSFSNAGLKIFAKYEYFEDEISDYKLSIERPLLPSDTSITISYSENRIAKSVDIPITVSPKTLQSISAVCAKQFYIEGEALKLDDFAVTAHYEYCDANIASFTVSHMQALGLNDSRIKIAYTENGIDKETFVDITIRPKTLQSIKIGNMPLKTEYIEGESFDSSGLQIIAEYEFLQSVITDWTVKNTDGLMPNDRYMTVSYTEKGITKTVDIPIAVAPRKLQSISISKMPLTNAYVEGQKFDKLGMEITAHYEFKDLIITNWEVDEQSALKYDATFVVVSYTENGITKTVNVPIVIADNLLDKVEIISPANKLDYSAGETLSMLGLALRAYYTNGTNRIVTGFTSDKLEPLTTADGIVTIYYTEAGHTAQVTKTVSYEISVTERILIGIEITNMPSKLTYVEGEFFDEKGLLLIANYSDGTYKQVENYRLNILGPLKVENNEITVTYTESGASSQKSIPISVIKRMLTGIEIDTQPYKTEYRTGERFDTNGLTIRAIYNNGSYTRIVTGYTVEKKNAIINESDNLIEVRYFEDGVEKSTNITITVIPRTLIGIEITSQPNKTVYKEGEYLDILGISVAALFSDAPKAEVVGWNVDKVSALKQEDDIVTVSYTESGITQTASFNIVVESAPIVDEEVIKTITAIDLLPDVDVISLSDEGSLIYAANLYMDLATDKRVEVTNSAKLLALLDKMIELKESQQPLPEQEYEINYALVNGLTFDDIDFTVNPMKYVNSSGSIALNSVTSDKAAQEGYEFVKWIDENGNSVEAIENLDGNKTYFAVFELTKTVNIDFYDYEDHNNKLISLTDVPREKFVIAQNGIVNKILQQHDLLCMAFYIENAEGNIVQIVDDGFVPNYNRRISVYIVTAGYRTVQTSNINDFTISYAYEYEYEGQLKSVVQNVEVNKIFILPIDSQVTITLNNISVKDILLDGESVGLTESQKEYTFVLKAADSSLEISFEYYIADNVVITFKGLNTKVYSYFTDGWDKHLSAADLSDIAFVFDQENLKYLNYYIIGESVYLYEDLAELEFNVDTLINVSRVENKFSIDFEYTGGRYSLGKFIGRQTIDSSLNDLINKRTVLQDIFDNLTVYIDSTKTNSINIDDFYAKELIEDITLYFEDRKAHSVVIKDGEDEVLLEIPNEGVYVLSDELPEQSKEGYRFVGYSLESNGEVLSQFQLDIILVNINESVIIYAIYKAIEGYQPPEKVDYSDMSFVNKWTASHSTNDGIVDTDITLKADGTYDYETKVNGEISVKISGKYIYQNNKISIQSLVMEGDNQLINKNEMQLNIEWVDDNLLIAPCFTLKGYTVNKYQHYLTCGNIKYANYIGNTILGEYTLQHKAQENDILSDNKMSIELFANGTASINYLNRVDDIIIDTQNESALFRISSDSRIWIISNSNIGTFDLTETLSNFVKSGQDYSSVELATYIAADEDSRAYASIVTFEKDGIISFVDFEGIKHSVNFNIINQNLYTAYLSAEINYYGEIMLSEDRQTILVYLNGEQILRFKRLE